MDWDLFVRALSIALSIRLLSFQNVRVNMADLGMSHIMFKMVIYTWRLYRACRSRSFRSSSLDRNLDQMIFSICLCKCGCVVM